ncbi:MAG TPA: hypothetical protein VFE35_05710 [Candidatus Cybelea sp.]|jgi:hypothetical protein|nr:hypothetical protein [Candidatus Cybelea sp.]
MKVLQRLGWSALALGGSLAVLAGCTAAQAPFEPPMRATAPSAARPVKNTFGPLVYVASSTGCALIRGSICRAMVSIYTYPTGEYQGKWVDDTGSAARSGTAGECADNVGNVYVTYSSGASGKIFEFAHGGTSPIATLSDPTGDPSACSVDPMTGNLAVVNKTSGSGTLLIYRGGSGTPAVYVAAHSAFSNVGYDNAGNAFVDGTVGLAELPEGGSSFRKIALDRQIESFGSVQWDGQHMTVADFHAHIIYRFAIIGTNGREIGSTLLATGLAGERLTQTWIEGNAVVAANLEPRGCLATCPGSVNAWSYPNGGLAFRNIGGVGDFANPNGVAISLALDPPR